MAINKVEITTENGTETLMDLTGDSVTPETLAEGATAHGANGEPIIGKMKAGGDMSKYFETVGSDTLTWDGNTEGKYFLSEASCHVSNFAPPLDELKKGGFFTFSLGSTSEDVPFTSDEIMSADEMGFGSGLTLVTENGNPYIIIVHTPNATASLDGMTLPANVPVGTYFYYGADDDYVKSLTINGYTFKKEVIKEEYLPPSVPREGMTVKSKSFTTVTSVHEWLEENFNKVLKAIMSAQGSAYSFVNMAKNNNSEGATYCFNLTNLHDMSGNVINYATYLVVIKPQSLEFTTGQYDLWEGTINTSSLSCTTNDTQIFNDEVLQLVGGEFTVLYVD